ncbi:MAG: hypothetical protein WCS03_08335 [Bacteroidota bacterium]
MDDTLTYHFNYIEQEKSLKIINFSSNIIKTIQNIPVIIVGIILFPIFLIFFIPVANLSLWWLLKKMQNAVKELNKDIYSLSYAQTKEGYDLLNSMIKYLGTAQKEIAPDADEFLIKGICGKFSKISATMEEMKETLTKTLFINSANMPYSEKEKESIDVLNDIWGDDSDQVYARHTHYHLIKKLKTNVI